jgi:Zn-dependent M28 family amino/carboxypeptidase
MTGSTRWGYRGVGCAAVLAGVVACTVTRPATVPPATPSADLARAEARITAARLAAHIRFLADDSLEGRGPGTRGDRLARLYVATTMQAMGLEPAGDHGSWEQQFDLLGVTTGAPAQWIFSGNDQEVRLKARRDFVAVSGVDTERARIDDAEVVFVGYGIQAPEFAWDDFKGADLRGKVLLVLNNDPDWDPQLFAGKRRLYYGRWTYKYENAARAGAAGAIIIHTADSAGYPWQTVVTSWTGENARLPGSDAQALAVEAWVTEAAARHLVTIAGKRLDDLVWAARTREFRPLPLGVTTSITLENRIRRYETANVLGMLRGGDPALRDQVVVYSAHHDHLGVKEGADGRQVIYNGAVDNAAGVAQLLAVGAAFTSLPGAPPRSVLFLGLAAEEQGLLGSEYFTRHPTVAPGQLVADLNFDGGNIWGPTRDVTAVGYGKSSLDDVARAAAARQERVYGDEQFPERGMFYRSDQFNFAKIGVPAILLRSGTDFVNRPAAWGRAQVDSWVAEHYHQPSDDFSPAWNLDGMVADARLAFAVGVAVASSTEAPAWVPGDEFEATRQRALARVPNNGP